jgi:hypothetical protein
MIETRSLPRQALLARYAGNGAYTDCFAAELDGSIDCARYVEAFYTTPLFRAERLILRLAIEAPSTDEQAHLLASGAIDRFAAWRVEDRAPDQLLMCDIRGSTRSWFMVERLTRRRNRSTSVPPSCQPRCGDHCSDGCSPFTCCTRGRCCCQRAGDSPTESGTPGHDSRRRRCVVGRGGRTRPGGKRLSSRRLGLDAVNCLEQFWRSHRRRFASWTRVVRSAAVASAQRLPLD